MLTDRYLQRSHVAMFGEVWRCAGKFPPARYRHRRRPHKIRTDLRQLYGEVLGWLEHDAYPPDKIAVRLHYRVVTTHPFPKGNGRHARLLAEIVMVRHVKAAPLP